MPSISHFPRQAILDFCLDATKHVVPRATCGRAWLWFLARGQVLLYRACFPQARVPQRVHQTLDCQPRCHAIDTAVFPKQVDNHGSLSRVCSHEATWSGVLSDTRFDHRQYLIKTTTSRYEAHHLLTNVEVWHYTCVTCMPTHAYMYNCSLRHR